MPDHAADTWCGAMLAVDDAGPGCRLYCDYVDAHPTVPHRSLTATPCAHCWCLELHADGCPGIDGSDPGVFFVEFDDTGTYWAATVQQYVTSPPTPLTKGEVLALPNGTPVVIVWSGGNGPHPYTVEREFEDAEPVAKTPFEPADYFDYDGKGLDTFIGQTPMYTRVWLAER